MKKYCLFIFCFFIVNYCNAQEILFKVIKDTPVWNNVRTRIDSNSARIINKNMIISNISPPVLMEINGVITYGHTDILFEKIRYSIQSNTFSFANNELLFVESFLSDYDPNAMIWVNSYFLEVMYDGNRDSIMPYEQGFIEYNQRNGGYVQWYEIGSFDLSLIITQSTLSIGGLFADQFLIQYISLLPNGYRVTVSWNMNDKDYEQYSVQRSNKINLPNKNNVSLFNFYFFIDGDYMDLFYSFDPNESNKIFCSSFVRIDGNIRRQIEGIIRYNHNYPEMFEKFDPSKITFWPRRADGGMDYPHHPLTVPGNSSAVYKFDDTVVKIEPLKENIIHNISDNNKNAIIQDNGENASLPLPLLLAIIGGAVVIAGVVAVVLRKKK